MIKIMYFISFLSFPETFTKKRDPPYNKVPNSVFLLLKFSFLVFFLAPVFLIFWKEIIS